MGLFVCKYCKTFLIQPMRFTDAIRAAYQTHWSYVNTFEVYFMWNPIMLREGSDGNNILNWGIRDNERISLHLVSLDIPQFTNQQISSFIAGNWRQIAGRDEQYKFSMTFRDSNQLEFYRKFYTQYREQRCRYFDNYKFDILVTKDSDYGDLHPTEHKGNTSKQLMILRGCHIEGLSQIQFSNATENQHVEFSVNFNADELSVLTDGNRDEFPIDDNAGLEGLDDRDTVTDGVNVQGRG